tara:strand:- start:895 stop:2535 length:1641 start_codon:yes stop_codon:yes gene_type:complete
MAETVRKFTIAIDVQQKDALKAIAAISTSLFALRKGIQGAASMFQSIITETANAGDAAAISADQVSMSAEAWQEYAHAADIAGVPIGRLRTALRRMGDNAVDAQKGAGQATDALVELFGTMDKVPKDQDKLFVQIMTHLHEMGDSAEAMQRKGGLLAQIFGRAGALSMPLIRLGPKAFAQLRQEARDLGIVLSDDVTRATQKFNDELIRVRRSWEGIRNTIGARLLPQITRIVTGLQLWVREQRTLIEAGLEPWIKTVEIAFAGAFHFFDRFRRGFTQFLGPVRTGIKRLSALTGVLMGTGGLVTALMLLSSTLLLVDKSLFSLVKTLLLLSLASLPYTAMILALGAAFTVAYLAIDDFITFLRGGDSILGAFLKQMGAFDEAKETIQAIKDLWESLGPDIREATIAVQAFGQAVLAAMGPELQAILQGISTGMSLGITKNLRFATQYLKTTTSLVKAGHGKNMAAGAVGGLTGGLIFGEGLDLPMMSPTKRRSGPTALADQSDGAVSANVTINNYVDQETLVPLNEAQVNAGARAGASVTQNAEQ